MTKALSLDFLKFFMFILFCFLDALQLMQRILAFIYYAVS